MDDVTREMTPWEFIVNRIEELMRRREHFRSAYFPMVNRLNDLEFAGLLEAVAQSQQERLERLSADITDVRI